MRVSEWDEWEAQRCPGLCYLPAAVSATSPSYLNAQLQGSPCSPEWEIGEKGCGCVWENLAHSPLMTKSG